MSMSFTAQPDRTLHQGSDAGPKTIEEFADWPADYLKRLVTGPKGQLRKRRLESCCQEGVVLNSDFSGRASTEVAFNMLATAMQEHDLDFHVPADWVRSAPLCTPSWSV